MPNAVHGLQALGVCLSAQTALSSAAAWALSCQSPSSAQPVLTAAGTYLYMSPEMIRHELYNSRTDVFSWGVMFVELLTQQRPYERLYMTPIQVSLSTC